MSDGYWAAMFGTMGTIVTVIVTAFLKYKLDQKMLAAQTEVLLAKSDETQQKVTTGTEVAKAGVVAAKKAYAEANDVNAKIAELRNDFSAVLKAHEDVIASLQLRIEEMKQVIAYNTTRRSDDDKPTVKESPK